MFTFSLIYLFIIYIKIGFYSGYQDVYGVVSDHSDGSYSIRYNINITGEYVLRLAIAEKGLNATYFNSTSFGYLSDMNFNEPGFESTLQGDAINPGTTKSWTGDIGGTHGVLGDIGNGSYFQRFKSRVDYIINFNLSQQRFPWQHASYFNSSADISQLEKETFSAFSRQEKFRQDYWSVSWMGLLKPKYAELYNFTIVVDSYSTVVLRVGGVGLMTNQSAPGLVLLNYSGNSSTQGTYLFQDTLPREFSLTYSHTLGPSYLQLYWESPSTQKEIIPESSFFHWVNVTHRNLTVHPAPLSSHRSNAFGSGLEHATVGVEQSIYVYARDTYGNLRQVGGDNPSLLGVSATGVVFRGYVTDYGNSTYVISYYPKVAGVHLLYVSMGCCPPHPNIGLSAELDMLTPLLIYGSPFILNITSGSTVSENSLCVGEGLKSGEAGSLQSFTIAFRDIHHNPTTVSNKTTSENTIAVHIYSRKYNYKVIPPLLTITGSENSGYVDVKYNLSETGDYNINVLINNVAALGSPYLVTIYPTVAFVNHTLCRGIGLYNALVNQTSKFEIKLHDKFNNALNYGGDRFYIRLVGVDKFQHSEIIPRCIDQRDGRYLCSYIAFMSGKYELRISLLIKSSKYPGGEGLYATYISSSNWNGFDQDNVVQFSRIDSQFSFQKTSHDIINMFDIRNDSSLNKSTVPLEFMSHQNLYIKWVGYILAPKTDLYSIYIKSNYFTSTIYIDSMLIYDTSSDILQTINMIENSVYFIVIESTLSNYLLLKGIIDFNLLWFTANTGEAIIPKFFLYPESNPVPLSPFPVQIS